MKTNYHTHTTWCDGANTPKEMAEAAIARGFGELGFSSHSDMLRDGEAYVADIRALADEYRGRLSILCGLEAEGGDSLGLRDRLDYVIGAVHYVTAPDGARVPVDHTPELLAGGVRDHFGGSVERMVREYFGEQREMIERGGIDALAHPDLVRKFGRHGVAIDETAGWYVRELELTADLIAAKNLTVEVNTGAISRGWMDDAYPSAAFRALLTRRGVSYILSSDAHAVDTLDTAFERFGTQEKYKERIK